MEMHKEPQMASETHAREELGTTRQLGSARRPPLVVFAFLHRAVIPLLPWFLAHGNGAVVASVILGAVAALVIGARCHASPDVHVRSAFTPAGHSPRWPRA